MCILTFRSTHVNHFVGSHLQYDKITLMLLDFCGHGLFSLSYPTDSTLQGALSVIHKMGIIMLMLILLHIHGFQETDYVLK